MCLILPYYALILPTASPAILPGTLMGFTGSASCIPDDTPEQIPIPCRHTIAFCSQPIPLHIADLIPQLTPPTSTAMLPAVDTTERMFWSGIAQTPVRTTFRIPLHYTAIKVAFAPNLANPSSTVNATALPGLIIAIRPNKGINFLTIQDFVNSAIL